MSSPAEAPIGGQPEKPRANESDWYNQHYKASGMEPSSKPLVEPELSKHLGPWYSFTLPHLRKHLAENNRLLELGCGTGRLLTQLAREKLVATPNIYGIDQSSIAIEQAQNAMPQANLSVGDIYDLKLPKQHFDVVLMMEVIEHLESPDHALRQIESVMVPGGQLLISFPNFVHLPWLVVRILSEKLNRPNWIVLQPIDKIYTVWGIRKLVERAGFAFEFGIGSNYGPPVFYKLERPWLTRMLNKLGLWWVSFHPIMVFRKIGPSSDKQV